MFMSDQKSGRHYGYVAACSRMPPETLVSSSNPQRAESDPRTSEGLGFRVLLEMQNLPVPKTSSTKG